MAVVWVIDDSAEVLRWVRRVLEDQGLDVLTFGGARDAMRRLSKEKPDIVITDVFMEDQDGLEVLRALRGLADRPEVVAISGGGVLETSDVLATARAFGADAVMEKPLERRRLVETINALLE